MPIRSDWQLAREGMHLYVHRLHYPSKVLWKGSTMRVHADTTPHDQA
jgi:hypothetical protein